MEDRLSKEEFGAWASNPTTKKVLQYWADYRQGLMEKWAGGVKMAEQHQGFAQLADDFVKLTFEDIETFYQSKEAQPDDDDYSAEDAEFDAD